MRSSRSTSAYDEGDDFKQSRLEHDQRRKDPIEKRQSDIEAIVRADREILPSGGDGVYSDEDPDLANELRQAASTLARWRERPIEDIENQKGAYLDDLNHFEQIVGRAIRKRWFGHPYVREWITNQRLFGDWDSLRRYKAQRLEAGVHRQISAQDLWIKFYAWPLVEQGTQRFKIRRHLINKLTSARMDERKFWRENMGLIPADLGDLRRRLSQTSLHNFYKILNRLGLPK